MLSWRNLLGNKRAETPQALDVDSDTALGYALEARMLFDGAVVATVDQAASTQQADSSTAASASSDAAAESSAANASQGHATSGTDSQASDDHNSADDLAVASDPARKEVVFIDTSVAGYQSLVNGVKSGVEVVLIDASKDGLSQIAVWAQTHSGYDAIHIISNGGEGKLSLGNITLDNSSLNSRSADLAVIGSALTDSGDILLYGCDVAKGSEGIAFISDLAALTSADVAASDDLTGAASLKGDWTLEAKAGAIESGSVLTDAAQNNYAYVLDTFSFASGIETGAYSNHTTWTEGGHTLKFDFVGNVNPYIIMDEGLYVVETDGSVTSNSLTLTISVADGYIFDFSALDILNADSTASYTISSNLSSGSDQKSGTLTFTGDYTFTTISGFNSGFTGVSSITLTISGTNQYYLDNLVLNNIRQVTDATSTVTAGPATEAGSFATTSTSVATATPLLDFTITDNGATDGLATTVSSLYATANGTATTSELSQMVFLLNGPDATNVVGTYDSATGRITFSGLSLSVANASSETYTVKAYYNDSTTSNDITEGHTVVLSVNASNFTLGSGSSTFAASQSSVTNGGGAAIDVTATKLVYSQSPSTSVVSGSDFGTQPVLIAVDARGNIDRDFNGTVTLSENGSGSLTGTVSAVAVNGTATFTGVRYTSASDADANFVLTASTASLTSANSAAIDPDVVATKLVFSTQPVPTTIRDGESTSFTIVPVVHAVDANGMIDRDFNGTIELSVTDPNDGAVDGIVNSLSVTSGDQDASATTVTLTATAGVATYSGLVIQYTNNGSSNTLALQAKASGLPTSNSTSFTSTSNAAPVFSNLNGGATYTENGTAVVIDSDVTVADSELDALNSGAGNYNGASITIGRNGGANSSDLFGNSGLLGSLVQGQSFTYNGVTVGTVTSNSAGTLTLTFNSSATSAAVDGVLQSITYSNSSDNPPASVTLGWTFSDGQLNSSGTNQALVSITAVNDAPVISNTAISKTFNEDTSQSFTAADFGFTDADGDSLASITIVTAPTAGQLFIDANGDGVYGSGDTLIGSGAVISAANISKLTFRPVENANGPGYATFTWKVSDGTTTSANTGTMTLNVTPVNDAPVIYYTSVSKYFSEDTNATFSASDFSFTDVDVGDTLQSITIVTLSGGGRLFIDADGDGVYGSGDTLVTAGTVVSAANISKMTFRPAENAYGTNYASFTWKVSDGTTTSANTGTMTLNVSAVNDAPVIGNTAVSKTFDEDTTQGFTAADFGFTDVDVGDTLQSITIVSAPTAGQLFIDADGDGVFGSGDTLIASGAVVSAANISKLTFRPAENANGTGYSSFSWKVSDGTTTSANTGTMTLNVTAVNDAPEIGNTAVGKTVNEDSALTFSATDFGFTDVDSGDTLQSITIVSAPTSGQLFIDADGDGVYGSGDTLLGNGALVSAVNISKLTFRPADNANGAGYASFTWTVSDGAASSANTGTMTLNVTAVNDAPVIGNTSVSKTFDEDTTQGFTAADFGFTDVDSGDTLQSITIVSAPTAGQLFIDADGDGVFGSGDTLLANGAVVSAANISKLTFRPADNANGAGYATFTWKVSDGTDTSANTGTMTLNVTAVNDAPQAGVIASQVVSPGNGFSLQLANDTFTDVDAGDTLTLSATLANGQPLPAWLSFDPVTGTFSGTPANGDIGSLSIRVTATDTSSASASSTFTLQVKSDNAAPPVTPGSSTGGDPEFRINDGRTPPPAGHGSLRLDVIPAAPVTLGALFAPASLGALNSGGAPDATVTASLFQAARGAAPEGNASASQLAGIFVQGTTDGSATQFDSALGSFPSFNNGGALGGSSSLSGVFSGIHLPSISAMEVFSGGSWRDISTSDTGESALRFNPGLQWQLQQSGEEELQRLAAIEQTLNELDQRQG